MTDLDTPVLAMTSPDVMVRLYERIGHLQAVLTNTLPFIRAAECRCGAGYRCVRCVTLDAAERSVHP